MNRDHFPVRWTLVTLLTMSVISVVTLGPSTGGGGARDSVLCLLCGDRAVADIVLNIVLFVPFGVALERCGVRPSRIALSALLFSGLIETIQVVIPGRTPTVRDLLGNALGAWLGAVVLRHGARAFAPGPRAILRLTASIAIVGAVITSTGLLLRPAGTPEAYFGHWAPRLEHLASWHGTVSEASVGRVALPHGEVPSSDALRDALASEGTIRVRGTTGPPTRDLSAIVAITDARYAEILLVGPWHEDLVVRVRRRAADMRLDAPAHRFEHALVSLAPGTPLLLEVHGLSGASCIVLNALERCAPRFATGSAWSLFYAKPWWPIAFTRVLDALAIFTLVLPVGLIFPAVGRRARAIALVALAVTIGFSATLTGLAPPRGFEWIAAFASLAVGAAFATARTRGRG